MTKEEPKDGKLVNFRIKLGEYGPEAFKVIEKHNASQTCSTGDDLCMYGQARGRTPQRAGLVPGDLSRQAGKMRELDDARAAALFGADKTCPQRTDHTKVARFSQRFFVIRLHITDARDAHNACSPRASRHTRVICKHLADVYDYAGGAGRQWCIIVVITFGEDGL